MVKDNVELRQLWDNAVEWALRGPLHMAFPALEKLLRENSYRGEAAILLADIHARMGEHSRGVELVSGVLRERGLQPETKRELRRRLGCLRRAVATLQEVSCDRFDSSGFLARAVAPGGECGYQAVELGLPGVWRIENLSGTPLSAAQSLRFCRSVLTVLERFGPSRSGELFVWVQVKNEAGISLAAQKEHVWVKTNAQIFSLPPEKQQKILRQSLTKKTVRSVAFFEWTSPNYSGIAGISESAAKPSIYLISPGIASNYGITGLKYLLREHGFPVEACFVRSGEYLEEYVKDALTFLGKPPDIVGISILNAAIEKINDIIAIVRQVYPMALIFLGGPSACQHPEHCAALVPDFDLLFRGYAEELFPVLAGIAGQGDREKGFSDKQLTALAGLTGGVLVKGRHSFLINRLNLRHNTERYIIPPAEKKSMIYFLQTSRGCPYICRFCNKWAGIRYDVVSPLKGRLPRESKAKGSARAVREWLLGALALHFPHGNAELLAAELKAYRQKGEVLPAPGLKEKIFVVFHDDEFLAHRPRIEYLHQEITSLGLQNYFTFGAVTSVRDLTRGGKVDNLLITWLKEMNFKTVNLGTDGLTQAVINQNGKGYSLDRQVFPLNAALRKEGLLALNNIILTTPYTTIPEMIESLLFMGAFPFSLNITMSIGVLGRIGNDFNNEDLVNLDPKSAGESESSYAGYNIPAGFPEFAVNKSTLLNCADPKVQEAVMNIAGCRPWAAYLDRLAGPEVWAVIKEMAARDEVKEPEAKALGQILLSLRGQGQAKVFTLLRIIKDNMSLLGLSSFVDYRDNLFQEKIYTDKRFLLAREGLEKAKEALRQKCPARAAKLLKSLISRFPNFTIPYREIIRLYSTRGVYRKAYEYFSILQDLEPERFFYEEFFYTLGQGIGFWQTYRARPELFHIAYYHTLSPLFYLLAAVYEIAGGKNVRQISIPPVRPADIEKVYSLLNTLTPASIKRFILSAPGNLKKKLRSGEVVEFCGIPAQLIEGCLIFDYPNCQVVG